MSEKTLTATEYAKFRRLVEKEVKQKRYQQVLNAKISLQAKWAKLNGCPVDTKHAEFYLGINESLRETLTISQMIDMVATWDQSNDANAHAVDMLNKNEGTEEPSLEDATQEEELDA